MATQKSFRVTWTIELDAPNELEASLLALEIQRDKSSEAIAFEVKELGTENIVHVDLKDE